MLTRTRTAWNIVINSGGVLVNMLAGLIVMPFLIQRLGASGYGLWTLVGSLTGYLGVLDLGVRPALGRLVAAHHARKEGEQINVVISTALALLIGICALIIVATLFATQLFPVLFPVPAIEASDVHWALILVGTTIALSFPSAAFDGMLWGYQRFDLINAIETPTTIARTLLIITFLSARAPLTSLATITLTVNVLSALSKAVLCFRIEPGLRVGVRRFQMSKVREIYSYGTWLSFISWSKTLIPQIATTIIGHRLGTVVVTEYAVARQLVAYSNSFANAATQVLAPKSIAAHATSAVDTQKKLFMEGGKFACALALYFCGGLICLGLPFIHRWQHGSQDASYLLMLILLAGEAFPMAQWVTYSVIVGSLRHRVLAVLAVCEFVMVTTLASVAVGFAGIRGVCVAVAISAFMCRGIIQWLYGCSLIRVSVAEYARRVLLPVALGAALPILALYAATIIDEPRTFAAIVLYGGSYTIVFAAALGIAGLGFTRMISAATALVPPRGGIGRQR